MFRPIKNLFTYIQKNTSGGSIFGGGGTGGASASETAEAAPSKSADNVEEDTKKVDHEAPTTSSSKRGTMENGKAGGLYTRLPLPGTPTNGQLYADDDPDDIELHIKSSIVVKSPRPSGKCETSSAAPRKDADHNQNVSSKSQSPRVMDDANDEDDDDVVTVVDEELHAFSDRQRVVLVEGPVTGREFYSFVVKNSTKRAELAESSYVEGNGVHEFLGDGTNDDSEQYLTNAEENVAASTSSSSSTNLHNTSVNSEDPLAIDEADFDVNVSASGVNLLDDDVVIDMIDEPNVVEEDLISLDSASSHQSMLWLTESSTSKTTTTTTTTTISATPMTPPPSTTTTPNTKKLPAAKSRTDSANVVNGQPASTCEEELPSDGSDSGLGSETSTLQNATLTDTSMADSPQVKELSGEPLKRQPLRSNLKRRLDVDDDSLGTSNATAASSSQSTPGAAIISSCQPQHQQKKLKRSINFDGVQVYYFQRQQGFGCVPSAGGCTLGMSATHTTTRTMTLAEHATELRRAHRLQLQQQQEANHQRHNSGASGSGSAAASAAGSSSDDSEESEEDYLSEGSGSDLDGETNGFLQPVSPKQRRVILKAAGVRKIDASEKIECRDIRNSREVCGCTCRDFCDPDTCACSQAGIKCQVDRAMFPCGCSRDACGNLVGRVEFNPARVRTHFIHTIMRLEMENRQQQNPPPPFDSSTLGGAPRGDSSGQSIDGAGNASGGGGYYGLQSQSAYSSGYASPAYSNDLPNYYQPQVVGDAQQQQQQQQYGDSNGSVVAASNAVSSEHSTTPNVYQMDSLDSGLFGASSANATPSYGELMPSYAATASYAHSMGYDYPSGQVSSYGAYHHLHQHHLPHAQHHHQQQQQGTPQNSYQISTSSAGSAAAIPTYNSCAVPSMPPYGPATTTTVTAPVIAQYPTPPASSLATTHQTAATPTTNVIVSTDSNGGSSFINLSSPIGSSSRLSQINDLLQHNRNTTAALVAVSTGAGSERDTDRLPNGNGLQHQMSSINTPPIEDAQKSCLNFEALSSPLHPTPIVAVLTDIVRGEQQSSVKETPPKPTEPPPPTTTITTTLPLAQTKTVEVERIKVKESPSTNAKDVQFSSTLAGN